ncbi:hypothetical protein EB796_023402 [Bugula neritina]|uniref:SLC5A7 n=1 Tax=Bugula neritina TaxID=10212 RepID=A0A7J7IXP9_BUGNE|nr:hypothetical protein EB796_023402 [Bugula neritina]
MFGGLPWQELSPFSINFTFIQGFTLDFPQYTSRECWLAEHLIGARILSFLGGIGCLLMAIPPVMIGAIGYSTDWNQTAYSGVLDDGTVRPNLIVPLVLQYLTPPAVAIIGLGAVSAAVMSSADSSMLSSSTMFAQNVYKPVFRPQASDREVIWVMRLAAVVFCCIAAVLAITIQTVYGLFVMCGDFVYVLLFPQLVSVMFVPWFNTFGSLTGFLVSLAVRLLGGEALLNWKAVVAFPWYDSETNRQYFPYKTLCMLIGLVVMLIVSYLTDRLMESGG